MFANASRTGSSLVGVADSNAILRPMRLAPLIFALAFLTGCTSVLATFRLSKDVEMDVTRVAADGTKFDLRVVFREGSEEYDYLIQEGDLLNGTVFVECWNTDEDGEIIGYDHHWQDIVDSTATPVVTREYKVYVGRVQGADLTKSRFGMLPRNIDGSVVTNIDPQSFNHDNYFAKGHKIQGTIVEKAQVSGTWLLSWQPGQIRVEVGNEFLVCSDGAVLVFQVQRGRPE